MEVCAGNLYVYCGETLGMCVDTVSGLQFFPLEFPHHPSNLGTSIKVDESNHTDFRHLRKVSGDLLVVLRDKLSIYAAPEAMF